MQWSYPESLSKGGEKVGRFSGVDWSYRLRVSVGYLTHPVKCMKPQVTGGNTVTRENI